MECQEAGKASVYPVEVGYQGFVGRTEVQLLHGAGTMDSNLQKAVKELVEEQASGCGFGGRTVIRGQCPIKGRYRGWQGGVPFMLHFMSHLKSYFSTFQNNLYNSH